jgi:hypothetical protein
MITHNIRNVTVALYRYDPCPVADVSVGLVHRMKRGAAFQRQGHLNQEMRSQIRGSSAARTKGQDAGCGLQMDFHNVARDRICGREPCVLQCRPPTPSSFGKKRNHRSQSRHSSTVEPQYNVFQESGAYLKLFRAERDESVPRELIFGKGVEVPGL